MRILYRALRKLQHAEQSSYFVLVGRVVADAMGMRWPSIGLGCGRMWPTPILEDGARGLVGITF